MLYQSGPAQSRAIWSYPSMPAFTSDTPRLSRTYQEQEVEVPAAYTAGHVLTEPEAGWVNSTVATIIGNGFGGYIRRQIAAVDKERAEAHKKGHYKGPTVEGKNKKGEAIALPAPATVDDIANFDPQAVFDDLYGKYVLAPGADKSASDPVSKMAMSIAEADLISRIKAKGHTVAAFRKAPASTDAHSSRFAEALAHRFGADEERYRAQARAALEAGASTDEGDDDLTL